MVLYAPRQCVTGKLYVLTIFLKWWAQHFMSTKLLMIHGYLYVTGPETTGLYLHKIDLFRLWCVSPLLCVLSNSVSCIEFLGIFCMMKFMLKCCCQDETLHLKN